MTNFASRIAGAATLALAVLPLAAISTAAAAAPAPSVQVSDINLNTERGQAIFAERVERTANAFCRAERTPVSPLARHAECRAQVRAELNEKMPAVRQAQIARNTYAAR
ncbi:UrcA family protein [Phenylobacterium sp. J367]|uniref:UrcA family protein n=1 Tax=Phenylobacterium sp. J367 TaxID=2898435 RepID=UPI002150E113|nr:UrcA family protein [Phenylobacterium sp. J367]MCR5878933.1 UrcA family protein [Phenylobacterium sp. J367]